MTKEELQKLKKTIENLEFYKIQLREALTDTNRRLSRLKNLKEKHNDTIKIKGGK